jgi:hypothetical protein
MKRIETDIEINEAFLPNSNLTYDIYYDGVVTFKAKLNALQNKGKVGVEFAPKELIYKMKHDLCYFTTEQKEQILEYRGLTLDDGFEASDVFMEKSFITLQLHITKDRFLDWYFEYGQDQEKTETRISLANSIISQMYGTGQGSYSVQELFDGCNQESIRAFFTQEFHMQTDDFDIELSDLGETYEINLV